MVFVSWHYRKCILNVFKCWSKSGRPWRHINQLPLYSYPHLVIREPKRIDFLMLFFIRRNDFIYQPTYHKEPFPSSVAFRTTGFNQFFSRNIPVFVTSVAMKMTVKTCFRHFSWLVLSIIDSIFFFFMNGYLCMCDTTFLDFWCTNNESFVLWKYLCSLIIININQTSINKIKINI